MCGRYAASRRPEDLVEEFEVDDVDVPVTLPARYNVAPTDEVYAVLDRGGRRVLKVVRWGLVPSWAPDRSIASRLINARLETVAVKPAFRRAFAARRCLLPADGYFEWYAGDSAEGGSRAKQPWFITSTEGGPLAFAGLYELWRDGEAWLWTATVITTTAEDSLGRLHDRMPLLVEPADRAAWLDPATSLEPGELLVPAAPGRLRAYPVSRDVGNVRNDHPALVAPLPAPAAGERTHLDDQPALF